MTFCFFFFNDTATTEIYTLSLHDALPISYSTSRPMQFILALAGGTTVQRGPLWWAYDGSRRPPRGDCAQPADAARPGAAYRHRDPPERAHPGRHQPDPLAEPLARAASGLAILPERLCRAHRQPRDADRQRAARKRDVRHSRGLVHRGLWHERVCADGRLGLAPGAAHA